MSLNLEEPVPKGCRYGTHRTVSPRETYQRMRALMPALGITRVANVTGLDRVGIPVVMVCRPNARSLAVSQGKGLSLDAARASGLMEAIELYHAERVTLPLKLASFNELCFSHRLVDLRSLPWVPDSLFHPDLRMLWIEGLDLLSHERFWLPYESVHLDCTSTAPGGGCFCFSSNGLASGNHILEALCQALCEVIERDAHACWATGSPGARLDTRLDLTTVDDPACQEVLEKYRRAAIDVEVFDLTSDLGVAAFLCTVAERAHDRPYKLPPSSGMGCHASRQIALLRALTEAAQSRLTLISGSRDDIRRHDYQLPAVPAGDSGTVEGRGFQRVPTHESDTFADDIGWLLQRLRGAGCPQVMAFDLSHPGLQIPVVRVVIPGLEGPLEIPTVLARPLAHRVAS